MKGDVSRKTPVFPSFDDRDIYSNLSWYKVESINSKNAIERKHLFAFLQKLTESSTNGVIKFCNNIYRKSLCSKNHYILL